MVGHIGKNCGHILRGHIIAPAQVGCGAGHTGHGQRCTGRQPQRQSAVLPRCAGKLHDIPPNLVTHKHFIHLLLHGQQFAFVYHGLHTVQQGMARLAGQNFHFRLGVRVAHDHTDHKTVQL